MLRPDPATDEPLVPTDSFEITAIHGLIQSLVDIGSIDLALFIAARFAVFSSVASALKHSVLANEDAVDASGTAQSHLSQVVRISSSSRLWSIKF